MIVLDIRKFVNISGVNEVKERGVNLLEKHLHNLFNHTDRDFYN